MGFQLFDPIGGKEKFFKSILYHELKLCTTTQTCGLQNDEFLNMEYKSYCLTKHMTDTIYYFYCNLFCENIALFQIGPNFFNVVMVRYYSNCKTLNK